jgi:hypothetical protein
VLIYGLAVGEKVRLGRDSTNICLILCKNEIPPSPSEWLVSPASSSRFRKFLQKLTVARLLIPRVEPPRSHRIKAKCFVGRGSAVGGLQEAKAQELDAKRVKL